jgi:hypothetical protein
MRLLRVYAAILAQHVEAECKVGATREALITRIESGSAEKACR